MRPFRREIEKQVRKPTGPGAATTHASLPMPQNVFSSRILPWGH